MNVIHPNNFREHVSFISSVNKSNKYSNPIKLSFHDGYESIFINAFPIMEEFGLKGIIFPITNYIGRLNDWDINFGINRAMHLNISQILSLYDHGWEIGSHGHLHRSFNYLTKKQIYNELITSKEILEDITGEAVDKFCPPFGDITETAFRIIEDLGFNQIFIQLPLKKKKYQTCGLTFRYSRSIYSIDSILKLERKFNNSKRELLKENIIHSFSKATVLVKEFL